MSLRFAMSQVEFYFSDSNILFDNHLRTKMSEHPEGFVSLEHIASFKRMQALTSDLEVVLRAIEKSEELVLSEDRTMVRRKNPLPEKNTTMERSIYAVRALLFDFVLFRRRA